MKSKKREIHPKLLEVPEQKEARTFLGKLMKKGYQPYTGKVFAEYPYKEELRKLLGGYIQREEPALYSLAREELTRTLEGGYDPYSSPYYQALRRQALKEEQEAVNRLRRQLAKTGMLRSSSGLGLEAKLRGETASKLATLLGGLWEKERLRRLETVPQAMTVGEFLEKAPLRTAEAITAISPLLKALEEEPLQWEYKQWKEAQEWPYTHQARLATILLTNQYPWYYPVYERRPSVFSQIVGTASRLAPLILSTFNPVAGAIAGGVGGINTGMQMTPYGLAPTWSPFNEVGERIY